MRDYLRRSVVFTFFLGDCFLLRCEEGYGQWEKAFRWYFINRRQAIRLRAWVFILHLDEICIYEYFRLNGA